MRFDTFMGLALFDPRVGYYRADRPRVGRARDTDFYTATSLGALFGELVAAAAAKLLQEAGLDPATHVFVEIGAEPGGGVLSEVGAHPFAGSRTLRLGDALELSGPCVVFSNELFDAQPVRRFVRRGERAWHELGVALKDAAVSAAAAATEAAAAGGLVECDLGPADDAVVRWLPDAGATPEGYVFDAPLAAAELARELAAQPWSGVFVAFDYGKPFAELGHAHPAGTARAYFRHAQQPDLLARPGEQDLTAHVCWDWLVEALGAGAGEAARVESQESFLVHHAGEHIAAALAGEGASAASPRKRALMHLLHPAQMGQKFQVLHALKPAR